MLSVGLGKGDSIPANGMNVGKCVLTQHKHTQNISWFHIIRKKELYTLWISYLLPVLKKIYSILLLQFVPYQPNWKHVHSSTTVLIQPKMYLHKVNTMMTQTEMYLVYMVYRSIQEKMEAGGLPSRLCVK